MVATRRQLQAGPDEELVLEQDPDQLLKKKAVRKPAARTAAAAAKAEANPKGSLRRKKVEIEPVEEPPKPAPRATRTKKITVVADPAPVEDETAASGRTSRAAKAGSVRGRKAATTTEDTTNEDELATSRPTGSTKTASVRSRKAAATAEEPAEEITVQTKVVATGSVRGRKGTLAAQDVTLPAPQERKTTRSTRRTANAAPLSPKKITQVGKAPAKTTKQATIKPVAKTTRSRAQANTKPTGKRRTVSDENADVPDLGADLDNAEDDSDDIVVLPSTPVLKSTTSEREAKLKQPVAVAESEASMSSRPTTPSDSPVQSFNNIEEEADADRDAESASEAEPSEVEAGDDSEDELCGPKTPMKRSSPSALARYQHSGQRTIRKHDEENRLETPAIRYAVLGTQRGTPQTQKPYCKPTAPLSEARPMTVSRAAGRAFVFKDLQDGAPSLPQAADDDEELEEPSFVVDEDIIPMDITNYEPDGSMLSTQPQPVVELNEAQLIANSLFEEDAEDYVVPGNVQKASDDPDDTVLIYGDDEDVEAPSEIPAQSFETEDTVIVSRDISPVYVGEEAQQEDQSEDDSVIIHPVQTVSSAESAPAHRDPFNFEEHLKDAFTRAEEDELNTSPAPHDCNDKQLEATSVDQDITVTHSASRRQTFDLNQFVDMAALSEPTLRIDFDMSDIGTTDAMAGATNEPEIGERSLTLDDVLDPVPSDQYDASNDDLEDTEICVSAVELEITSAEELDANEPAIPEVAELETQEPEDREVIEEPQVPHYALPTLAFDARRKSLPVLSMRTPIRTGACPSTSDGASMPRIVNPFSNAWSSKSSGKSVANTPSKPRPSTSHATPIVSNFTTPVRSRQTAVMGSAAQMPKDRYPLFPPQAAYGGHRNTVAVATRFATPSKDSPKRRETFHRALAGKLASPVADSVPSTPAVAPTTPKERYPALRSRENYEEHGKTVAAPRRFRTPVEKSPNRRETFQKALPVQNIITAAATHTDVVTLNPTIPIPQFETGNGETPATGKAPETSERYPRRRPQQVYMEHAKTTAGPRRFNTPVKGALKRPATIGKSASLRFAALNASTPPSSHTPMKTPLKGPAMTPSQVPMTPHPAAPLRAVVALVEVFTLEGASASAPFISLLNRLGAKITRAWNDRITHVVFKDGSPTTLHRVRLNNKDFEETGKGTYIHCVNSRWVTDCDTEGIRVDESRDAYIVDVAEVPRGGKRRRKSMEPSALLNLGGNIVRDRKSSGGRVSSFGRSPVKLAESPAKLVDVAEVSTPHDDATGKENSGDEQSSPATPAWIAAPSQLVQQTAPMKRVRKLELPGKGEAKSRRLTFWNGAA